MVMQKQLDKKKYFQTKVKDKRPEVERKLLNDVTWQSMEVKLEEMGAIEVFRGEVISYYYDASPEFLANFFKEYRDIIKVGSSGGFWRLREMNDKDGSNFYFAETRLHKVQISLFGAERMELTKMFDNYSSFDFDRRMYSGSLNLRQIEKKERLLCILPKVEQFSFIKSGNVEYVRGLEYALDKITEPTHVDPYLEVEAHSVELYFYGVKAIGRDTNDFIDCSAKKLIDNELKK